MLCHRAYKIVNFVVQTRSIFFNMKVKYSPNILETATTMYCFSMEGYDVNIYIIAMRNSEEIFKTDKFKLLRFAVPSVIMISYHDCSNLVIFLNIHQIISFFCQNNDLISICERSITFQLTASEIQPRPDAPTI